MTYGLIIVIPMVFVWAVVVFDVVMRRDLSPLGKAGWLLVVTLVWPTMILYLLLRPVQGRLVSATRVRRHNPERRQLLVEAVLEHRAGRLDQKAFQERMRQLRHR